MKYVVLVTSEGVSWIHANQYYDEEQEALRKAHRLVRENIEVDEYKAGTSVLISCSIKRNYQVSVLELKNGNL